MAERPQIESQLSNSDGFVAKDDGVAVAAQDEPKMHLATCVSLALFTIAAMILMTHLDVTRFPIQLTDEVGYLQSALQNLDRPEPWNIYSFPMHILTYAMTGLFEADPVRNYQLNAFVPFYIMVFLFQLHVLRQTGSALIAVLLAAPLLLAGESGLRAWPHSNQTVCIIMLAGLLLVPKKPPFLLFACCITVLYFLVGFARAEQILSLYLALLLGIVWALLLGLKWRSWTAWRQKFAWPIALCAGLLLSLSLAIDKPVFLDKYRSHVAFYQHFAYNLWLRSDDARDPWTESELVFEEYFGDATSISGALSNNPAAVFDHIAANLKYIFANWALSDPVGALGWVLALIFYFASLRILIRGVVSRWRAGGGDDLDLWRCIIGLAPLPTLMILLLIFPRTNYLQMSYVLLLASSLVMVDFRSIRRRLSEPLATGFAIVAATGTLALLKPLPVIEDPVLDVLETIALDAASQQRTEIRLATSENLCVFFALSCTLEPISIDGQSVAKAIEDGAVDYVIAHTYPHRPSGGGDLHVLVEAAVADAPGGEGFETLAAPENWSIFGRKN